MNVAIICAVKCEELYIKDWLNWNMHLGVDHIFLADNNDIGYKYQLKDIVKSYIDSGYVTIYDYADIKPVQMKCYSEIYNRHKTEYDWIGFMDVDEYLYIYKYKSLKEMLQSNDYKQYGGIYVFWKLYDDNNLLKYQPIPLNERFTHPAKYWKKQDKLVDKCILLENGESQFAKSFIRGNLDINILSNSSPHMIFSREQQKIFKQICVDPRFNLKNTGLSYFQRVLKSYEVAELRHYRYMTIEEFLNRRYRRGSTCYRGLVHNFNFDAFWILNEKTECKYDIMLNWIDNNMENTKSKKFLMKKIVDQKNRFLNGDCI